MLISVLLIYLYFLYVFVVCVCYLCFQFVFQFMFLICASYLCFLFEFLANSERIWPHCDRDHDETTSNNGPSSLVCGNEPNKQKDRRGKPYIAISFILRILKIQKTIIKFAYCNDKFFWLFTFEYVLIFFFTLTFISICCMSDFDTLFLRIVFQLSNQ